MKKPIIGITLDNEKAGYYSKFPWYAIRQNYLHSIEEVGGIPFPLFHDINSIEELSERLDGLIITGGNFDINPEFYGAPKTIYGSEEKSEYHRNNIDDHPIKKEFIMRWTKKMSNEHKHLEKQMGANSNFKL